MPMQTGWVIAATAGSTVDGRIIEEQWIKDMAESYNPTEYTALIWPEHFRSSWCGFDGKNWGTVDALKHGIVDGVLRLFAKLTANDYLLAANADDQKLFMSIEPEPNFRGAGKCYLMGLAVTDSPASTGTTRLKFSAGGRQHDHEVSKLEVLNRSDFIKDQNTTKTENGQEKGLFAAMTAALTDVFKKFNLPEPAPEPEEIPMEELAALTKAVSELTTKVDGVVDTVTALDTKVTELEKKVAGEPEPEPAPTPAAGDEFSKQITALIGKLDGIDQKFNKLSAEKPGQEPDPTGGEQYSVV